MEKTQSQSDDDKISDVKKRKLVEETQEQSREPPPPSITITSCAAKTHVKQLLRFNGFSLVEFKINTLTGDVIKSLAQDILQSRKRCLVEKPPFTCMGVVFSVLHHR